MVSPADLEKVEFSVSFRGYNGDQVDDYIDMVVKEFTELTNEYEKYKVLCEKQNQQIKIMRERILELEALPSLPNESVVAPVATEPEIAVKTIVKTVVDTEATKRALEKAEALEKLTAEFKTKALELYNSHLSELEALSFDYVTDDFTVEEQISEAIEDASSAVDEVFVKEDVPVEELIEENDVSVSIEELSEEETYEIEKNDVASSELPLSETDTTEDANEQSPVIEEGDATEIQNDNGDEILSADELGALFESSDDELKSIIDELSGLFSGNGVNVEAPAIEEKEPVKVKAASNVVQQSFDSLFITSVDDGE